MRVRGQIRRVRFDHQVFCGNACGDLLNALGVFEGDDARKGDHPSTSPQLFGHLRTSAVAVKYTSYVGVAQDGLEAIAVGVAIVDDDGQIPFFGQ